jgi:hypothetical protein
MSFNQNLIYKINPILDVSFNSKTLKYDVSWKSLQDLEQNDLEQEFDTIFYTNNIIRFQDALGSFHVYRSKNFLTLKEILDAMLHFEKMDRVYVTNRTSASRSEIDRIFHSFEKTAPDTFKIVWTN